MKLELIAQKTIEIIKAEGSNGITPEKIAEKLNIRKRRIYDVKAIMKAANLISTHRDRNGTKLYWNFVSDEKEGRMTEVRSNKIRITTTGSIKKVTNRGTEVIIESNDPKMSIEAIE